MAIPDIQPNLSGQYIGSGFDIHDGPFSGSRLEITLDDRINDIASGHTAYHCKTFSAEGVETYVGSIIANGNQFAMSFRNILPGQEADHGVLFGTVTHDRDQDGKHRTVLHNVYYQPDYKNGGHGTAVCIKN